MKAAKLISGDFTGAGPHVVTLDPAYFNNQIELAGVTTGVFTFRAWGAGGDGYGDIENGTLDAAEKRTITINGAFLERIEITPPGAVAFGVRGRQSQPVNPS